MIAGHQYKLSFIELLFIICYVSVCLSPKLNVSFPMLYFVIIEIIYVLYIMYKEPRLQKNIVIFFLSSLIIALLYTYTTSIVYVSENVSNRATKSIVTMFDSYFSFSFPIFVSYRLLTRASTNQKLFVLIFSSIVLFVILNITWGELQVNARVLKSQMEADLESDNPLVGGYQFVCAAPILLTASFYAFLRSANKLLKYALLAVSVFFVIFLIESMYSIALLAGLLGIITCLYCTVSGRYKKLFLILPFVILPVLPVLLNLFIGILDDESDTKLRMMELYNFFTSGNLAADDLGARIHLYGRSIKEFLSSPIWGVYQVPFNPHSTIFEILASLGILGFIPFVKILKGTFSIENRLLQDWSILPCFIALIFMALTNPIHTSLPLNVSMWLLVPLLYDTVQTINIKD